MIPSCHGFILLRVSPVTCHLSRPPQALVACVREDLADLGTMAEGLGEGRGEGA